MTEINTTRTAEGIEIYENGIAEYLDAYIAERQIEDMHKEPQSRWNAALLYINKYLFKPNRDILKLDNYCSGNLNYNNQSNNNAYDTDKVNRICDIYIDLCYEYDKEISVMGFSKLTGIVPDTVYSWAEGSTQLGSSGSLVYKKLSKEREESLAGMLISGKRNPVGVLGVLNHSYNWNMPGVREQTPKKALTADQLPKLGNIENDRKSIKPLLDTKENT